MEFEQNVSQGLKLSLRHEVKKVTCAHFSFNSKIIYYVIFAYVLTSPHSNYCEKKASGSQ
jgi:hypothetical protein